MSNLMLFFLEYCLIFLCWLLWSFLFLPLYYIFFVRFSFDPFFIIFTWSVRLVYVFLIYVRFCFYTRLFILVCCPSFLFLLLWSCLFYPLSYTYCMDFSLFPCMPTIFRVFFRLLRVILIFSQISFYPRLFFLVYCLSFLF
ncbi:hypothetical protein EGW08_008485 [Elysia chlorotica]|uniref:TLC domain-containing protein n=1 Tax=Elysia chlorotica TaxID=188477 RepID=A0A433TQ91_ELYCH|nr:hypothetical protein EGW08_008485 [Elysia chlorotica]